MTMEERSACLAAGPEVASLNLAPDMSKFKLKERRAPLSNPRPAIEIDECIPFTYGQIHQFAAEMKRRGIKPELELYHPGCAWVVNYLIENDLIQKPYWMQTVMGYQTGSFPTVENILQLLKEFPAEALWLCSAIGPFQLPLTTLATLMGGHVRVGLEDNVYYSRGRKAKSNAELVQRSVRIAQELNRPDRNSCAGAGNTRSAKPTESILGKKGSGNAPGLSLFWDKLFRVAAVASCCLI